MGAPSEEFGPYVVYEQLGLGGMATVHRAETQGIAGFSKQVALKRMLPSVAADASLVKSFIREARLASHLHHTNVAQTYDLGKVGDTYFIAMELVPGRNLREVLKHCAGVVGHIPMAIALNIINQICDALDYAHELCDETGQPLGIIHRDVSPSNIIVSEGGVVKLIDFGIAKASGKSGMNTMSGTIKGKFGYMAPETLMGTSDARADLFAVGVIAHELLANRPLFQGKDDMDTLYRVKDMPILPPSRINPQVPPELDSVVMTALDRNPDHRWQRANALRQALTTEIKRLSLVAHNSEVLEWVDWAFQQKKKTEFDVDSEPMIQISSGTSQMPMPALPPRRATPVPSSVPADEFTNDEAHETIVRSTGSKPIQAQNGWKPPTNDVPTVRPTRPDDWNVATDATIPASDALDRPIASIKGDGNEWNRSSDMATKLVRKSAPVISQPDPHLVDTRRDRSGPVSRPSSPHVVQRTTPVPAPDPELNARTLMRDPPPARNTPMPAPDPELNARTLMRDPPPGRNTPVPARDSSRNIAAPSPSMSSQQIAQHADQERTLRDSHDQARFDQLDEDDIRTDDRASSIPSTNSSARTLMLDPARSAPYVPPAAAVVPSHASTLQGAGVGSAASPAALAAQAATAHFDAASSGARTSPRMPAAAPEPAARGMNNLDARGERPAAGRLTPNPTGSVAKTMVEPAARRGASNFLLAVLVLIAAGGAAAVVYFALPYLT